MMFATPPIPTPIFELLILVLGFTWIGLLISTPEDEEEGFCVDGEIPAQDN